MKTRSPFALALAAFATMGTAHPTTEPLLKIGSVSLCREAILGAEAVEAPRHAVSVRLTKATQRALHKETSALVGKPITLSLGEKVLSQITILQPVDTSVVSLPAHSSEEAKSIAKAARHASCPL